MGRGGGGRSIDSPGPSLALGSWPSLAGVLSQGSSSLSLPQPFGPRGVTVALLPVPEHCAMVP